MDVSAQELRRRWTDKTNAVFTPSDRCTEAETYRAEPFEREFDFKGCRSIVFLNGVRTGAEADVLLLAQGTGHMTLPAGVQVLVNNGYVKCEPAYGSSGAGSTIGVGIRAPPPSRVGSQVGSTYSSGPAPSRNMGGSVVSGACGYRRTSMPSPPRDGASFSRVGSSRDTYVSARGVPLPPSVAGDRDDDWFVHAAQDQDDRCSIAPSESISSVGSRRGGRSLYQ